MQNPWGISREGLKYYRAKEYNNNNFVKITPALTFSKNSLLPLLFETEDETHRTKEERLIQFNINGNKALINSARVRGQRLDSQGIQITLDQVLHGQDPHPKVSQNRQDRQSKATASTLYYQNFR